MNKVILEELIKDIEEERRILELVILELKTHGDLLKEEDIKNISKQLGELERGIEAIYTAFDYDDPFYDDLPDNYEEHTGRYPWKEES